MHRTSIAIVFILIFFASGCSDYSNKETLFVLLDKDETGVAFSNTLEESHEMNIISYPDFYSGGGVSIGDIDDDDLPDLFFTGNQVSPKLYKNKGNFVFEDITEQAGLARIGRGWFTGTTMADINSDGYLDIYICKSGMEAPEDRANLLFINNRNGTFTEKAKEYGLDNKGFGVNATFFDYDQDGDLDIYIANQVSARLNSVQAAVLRKESHPFAGDKLYENLGDESFVDVTEKAGLFSSQVGFAHGAAVGDINDDGWEDLFVSNDFFEFDYLYINNGDKTFTETIKSATKHISHFSMGNDLADFNNDGLLDLVVLDMVAEDNRRLYSNTGGNDEQRFMRTVKNGLHYQYMFNVLHLNNGNDTFSEIGMLAGISRTDWSWAPLFADFDNDGWKDLFVTNGIRHDIRNIDWGDNFRNLIRFINNFSELEASQWDMLLNSLPSEKVTNYIFKNNQDLTFSKTMDEWGIHQKSWSNGAAYGDLDNDGDLDLVINNVDEPAFIYKNTGLQNYLRLRFEGSENNKFGIGTKVYLTHNENKQYQQLYTARGYRSSVEPMMHFGLGIDTIVSRIDIIWPDGKTNHLENISSNQTITLRYNDAKSTPLFSKKVNKKLFYDLTDSLSMEISHRDNKMIDYMREPMLPYKLSSVGVAFDVGDVNNDGLDDFFLGGSGIRSGQLYVQNVEAGFDPVTVYNVWEDDASFDDVGAHFFDVDNDLDLDLYVISGGNEYPERKELYQDRLYINDGAGNFQKGELPEILGAGSVARSADYDQDGDLDLFVGGRMVPGQYPLPADSYLLENVNGKLINITNDKASGLLKLGLVTDAVWTDYDNDEDLDLVVVGEWMPVTIFENENGKLSKIENVDNGLEYSNGWWWSIVANDVDGDGDEDLVVGNIGLNYKFKATKEEPLELFYGFFENEVRTNFIIGYHQDGKIFPTVDRTKVIEQNESIGNNIPTNNEYAVSDLYKIYGKETLANTERKKIYTTKSSLIINEGDKSFSISPMDNYAQISNINSLIVQDFDRDGIKDIIAGGNLYDIEAETIRNDAGIGVYLKGIGNGNFESVPYSRSGLYVEGDVRYIKSLQTKFGEVLITVSNDGPLKIVGINTSSGIL